MREYESGWAKFPLVSQVVDDIDQVWLYAAWRVAER